MDGQLTEMNYAQYRRLKTMQGSKYEQFIIKKYYEIYGVRLHLLKGKKNQLRGETEEGVEIKYDGIMKKTGNVYIEMAEKAKIRDGDYVESGIYRNDNTIDYLIGDYDRCFIFKKQALIELDRQDPSWLIRPKPTDTSIGFCIPVQMAKCLAERYIEF